MERRYIYKERIKSVIERMYVSNCDFISFIDDRKRDSKAAREINRAN